jgi:uncharacterized protein (TIGR00369 family)
VTRKLPAAADLGAVLTRVREEGRYDAFVDAIPYARFLGLRVTMTDGVLVTHMSGSDRLIGNPMLPALHGGTLGALLECAAIFALLWEGGVPAIPKTINLTVEYLRSARVDDTHARATITKQGRRVASVRVVGWQKDPEKPVVSAQGHFLLRGPPGESG